MVIKFIPGALRPLTISYKKDREELRQNQEAIAAKYKQHKEGTPQTLYFHKDYLIVQVLGKGGQGEVWLLYHPETKDTVVLKQMFHEKPYKQERDVYQDINHKDPQCKTIFKLLDIDDELKVLTIERGDSDLKKFVELRVSNKQPLTVNEIVYVFITLLKHQQSLWEYGYAMCDMKEENVLLKLGELGAGYTVKLADMGGCWKRDSD